MFGFSAASGLAFGQASNMKPIKIQAGLNKPRPMVTLGRGVGEFEIH